jgi:hypothetical protein
MVRAVGVTSANVPEASVLEPIVADLPAQGVTLQELHIDRTYLSSPLVRERLAGLEIFCKAWPVRNGTRLPKQVVLFMYTMTSTDVVSPGPSSISAGAIVSQSWGGVATRHISTCGRTAVTSAACPSHTAQATIKARSHFRQCCTVV